MWRFLVSDEYSINHLQTELPGPELSQPAAVIYVTTYIHTYTHTHIRMYVCVYVFSPQPTYGDEDMETHQNCGVCSVSGDNLGSPEKRPLKTAFYGF